MFHRRDSRPKQHPPILTAMYEADLVRRSRHQRRASIRLSRAGTSSILNTTPTNNEIEKKTLHAKGDSTTTMTTTKTSRRRQTKHQITTYCLPSWGSAQPTPLHAVHVVPHFLPPALCDLMVLESQSKQFTKARHKHFPTVDIPLRQMTQSYHQFYPLLQSTVYPYIRELYRLPHGKFSIVDLFVVKYSSRGQVNSMLHHFLFGTVWLLSFGKYMCFILTLLISTGMQSIALLLFLCGVVLLFDVCCFVSVFGFFLFLFFFLKTTRLLRMNWKSTVMDQL